MVKVISKELEKVLVEQNHCQGLNMVMKSWYGQQRFHLSEIGQLTTAEVDLLPIP
jgi:hypothetical protein